MVQTLLSLDTSLLIWARGLVGPDGSIMIQILGELIVVWGAIFLVGLWLRGVILHDTRYRIWSLEIFSIIILTFILHLIVNLGLPESLWRTSPQIVADGIRPLIPHPIDNSFPSGHALFSASLLFGVISVYRKWYLILLTIIGALLTASARVIGGVHYPGDILGGWVFGFFGAWISTYIIATSLFRVYLFPAIIRMMSSIRL